MALKYKRGNSVNLIIENVCICVCNPLINKKRKAGSCSGWEISVLLSATTTKAQYQMQRGFFLDVVVRQCSPVLQLLAGKDETLLIRWDTFFVLDLLLDVFDRVTGFDVKRDGLPGQSFNENLHGATEACVCVCVCKSLGLMFV